MRPQSNNKIGIVSTVSLFETVEIGEMQEIVLKKLQKMQENTRTTARDYETLLESLIFIFQSIEEVR